MNCGMTAEIIRYGSSNDIDVRFEDGTIIKHKNYGNFLSCKIAAHPELRKRHNRNGEKQIMKCGMMAEIIRYGSCMDIDVEFEDGVIVEHREYQSFKKGAISYPKFKNRIGKKRRMNCGIEAQIIRYGDSRDIDVRFEDGTTVEHRQYDDFLKGAIAHPNLKNYQNRVGEKQMMHCGMKAEIVTYRTYNDIDILFENGTIVKNKNYQSFLKGHISYPHSPGK